MRECVVCQRDANRKRRSEGGNKPGDNRQVITGGGRGKSPVSTSQYCVCGRVRDGLAAPLHASATWRVYTSARLRLQPTASRLNLRIISRFFYSTLLMERKQREVLSQLGTKVGDPKVPPLCLQPC